jgi:hypothetical protein
VSSVPYSCRRRNSQHSIVTDTCSILVCREEIDPSGNVTFTSIRYELRSSWSLFWQRLLFIVVHYTIFGGLPPSSVAWADIVTACYAPNKKNVAAAASDAATTTRVCAIATTTTTLSSRYEHQCISSDAHGIRVRLSNQFVDLLVSYRYNLLKNTATRSMITANAWSRFA